MTKDEMPSPERQETADERARRIRHEADIIAQAHADIDAGLGIEDADMDALLDHD